MRPQKQHNQATRTANFEFRTKYKMNNIKAELVFWLKYQIFMQMQSTAVKVIQQLHHRPMPKHWKSKALRRCFLFSDQI